MLATSSDMNGPAPPAPTATLRQRIMDDLAQVADQHNLNQAPRQTEEYNRAQAPPGKAVDVTKKDETSGAATLLQYNALMEELLVVYDIYSSDIKVQKESRLPVHSSPDLESHNTEATFAILPRIKVHFERPGTTLRKYVGSRGDNLEAQLQPGYHVLDLGTGLGWVAEAAARRCRLAIGIGISGKNIQLAKQNASRANLGNLTYTVADFALINEVRAAIQAASQELNVSPVVRFDVIFISWSLSVVPAAQHLPLLRDLGNLVKPGGKVVFDFQSPDLEMQSIQVNFAIMSPIPGHGSPFQRIGTTLRKYVGSREGFLKARTAIRALAREAG
ncbi:hypothetical protein KCU88_g850, partial [Aureobasidium melanogenum]